MSLREQNAQIACGYKHRFETYTQATSSGGGKKYGVYKCPVCRGFHHCTPRRKKAS